MDDPETPGGTPLPRGLGGAGNSGTTMIDTKAYGRPRTFSGKEEEWTTWVFVARSYMSLLSPRYDHYLSVVEETDDFEQIALSSQGPEAKQLSWADPNTEILRQRSCRSGPTGLQDPDRGDPTGS